MAFTDEIRTRSAAEYADFLVPHLDSSTDLLDAGCGTGTISVGLARHCASITAFDATHQFADAVAYAEQQKLRNVRFETGDVYSTPFPDAAFDACLAHSVLEALDDPSAALDEFHRVLRGGGVMGAASIDYGGILIGGQSVELLRRFYDVREKLWIADGLADPYFGRRLRGLLHGAGFEDVTATTKYFTYGSADSVSRFGLDRAADCDDPWYSRSATDRGLLTSDELEQIQNAWQSWSRSEDAFLAFPWCRAVGWKAHTL